MSRLYSVLMVSVVACHSAFGAIDRGLVALLPSDTQLVANINAQEARNSDFGRFLLRDLHWSDPKLQQMMTATGFDPRRDLVTVMIAGNRTPESRTKQHGGFVVLARGNFDKARIGGFATQGGFTIEKVGGVSLYSLKGDGSEKRGLAFLDADVAVMGDLDQVRQVLSVHATPAPLNPRLDQLLEEASADHDVWFASAGSAEQVSGALEQGVASQHARLLQSIVSSTGGIRFGSDVEFSVHALTRSDKDANSLADVVRFLASAVQVKRDQDPNVTFLGPVLDHLKLTTDGSELRMSTSLPESALEALAGQMQNHRGRARPIRYQGAGGIK